MFVCIHCRAEINATFKACPFCGEAMTDFLRRFSNSLIDGKYQLLSRLGVGGMGEVYKALHVHLNAIRVIKVMRPQLDKEEGAHDRFLREARLATRIQHPNVATLFDFSTLDDDSRYMVWEYIEGINLHEMIQSRGPLSPRYAAMIAVQALHGLDAIHRAGIVHRDVSPENLMIFRTDEGDERVKIIDLGIAKSGVDGDDKTKTGMFVGKWKYCSPEHLGMLPEGERIDGRADLYSFGIVLYEMLTGVPPFQADTPHSYLMMHASERPKAPRDVNPTIASAPAFEALMFKALEKDRRNRFQSAREFANAIEKIESSLPDSAGAVPPLPASAEVTAPATAAADVATLVTNDLVAAPTVITAVAATPKRRSGFLLGVAAAIAIATTGAVMWRRHPAVPVPQPKPAPPIRAAIVTGAQAQVPVEPAAKELTSTIVVAQPAQRGRIGITAFPWAEITKIVNTRTGDEVPVSASLVTPVAVDLEPGRYEITFANPSFGKSVRRTVNIAGGEEQRINVTFTDATSAALPAFTEDGR